VLGISIGSRHDDRKTARQTRWGPERWVVYWMSRQRVAARRQAPLEDDVGGSAPRRGGGQNGMRVRERDCPAQVGCDHT
jgi:hypothetical protein